MTTAPAPRTAAAWNDYYAATEHPYCWAACGRLVTLAATMPAGRAVDLGCGCGRHARALAEMGWHVEAIDYSSAAIEIARAGGETDLIDYQLADLCWWHPHTPVSLVLVAYPTLPPNALNAVIARAAGWLTPDGALIYVGDTLTDSTCIVLSMHFAHGDESPPPTAGSMLVCCHPLGFAPNSPSSPNAITQREETAQAVGVGA